MVSVLYTYSALNMNAFEFYFLLHWLFCWIAPGFFFFFFSSPSTYTLKQQGATECEKKKLLYFLNNGKTRNSSGGSEAATRLFEMWCVRPRHPTAVRPASWAISAKWTWTNAVPRPATTAPFARILLIATSATAGQVSHSPVFWSSQFALKTSQPKSMLFFFFIFMNPSWPRSKC